MNSSNFFLMFPRNSSSKFPSEMHPLFFFSFFFLRTATGFFFGNPLAESQSFVRGEFLQTFLLGYFLSFFYILPDLLLALLFDSFINLIWDPIGKTSKYKYIILSFDLLIFKEIDFAKSFRNTFVYFARYLQRNPSRFFCDSFSNIASETSSAISSSLIGDKIEIGTLKRIP